MFCSCGRGLSGVEITLWVEFTTNTHIIKAYLGYMCWIQDNKVFQGGLSALASCEKSG